jgi:hypothetical protein
MSFLGVLGNIGKGLLGLGGGGASPDKIADSVLSKLGAVSGGAAQGSAGQRKTENDYILQQQRLLQTGARDQFDTGMRAAEFQRDGQDRERRQAVLQALLQGTQDQSITPGNPAIAGRMPTVTGGARPSNLTGNPQQLQALLSMLSAPQTQAPQYQAPAPFQLQKAGAGEKILGGVGIGTSILGALAPLLGSLGQRD